MDNNQPRRRSFGALNRPSFGQRRSPRFRNTSFYTGGDGFVPPSWNSTQDGYQAGIEIGGNQTPIIRVTTQTNATFNIQIMVGDIPVTIPVTVIVGEAGNVVDNVGLAQQHTGDQETHEAATQLLGNAAAQRVQGISVQVENAIPRDVVGSGIFPNGGGRVQPPVVPPEDVVDNGIFPNVIGGGGRVQPTVVPPRDVVDSGIAGDEVSFFAWLLNVMQQNNITWRHCTVAFLFNMAPHLVLALASYAIRRIFN